MSNCLQFDSGSIIRCLFFHICHFQIIRFIKICIKYFHELVDSWVSRGKLNYLTYSNLIELEDWWHLEAQLKKAASHYIDSESDEQALEFLNGLDDQFKSDLLILLSIRKTDLRSFFVRESNSISHSNLKDFDWSLKV